MTEQLTPHRTDSPRPRVSFAELPTVYPTTSLLLAIFLTAGGLLLAWTAVRIGWGFDAEVYVPVWTSQLNVALSLYFALPMQPKALLIGAVVGYVIILVADIGTMLKASSRSSATGQKA